MNLQFKQSKPVEVIPFQERWQDEFLFIAKSLRKQLGCEALRIDHIGSTAVPGLSAKDIIDVQITLNSLDDATEFVTCMQNAGYRKRGNIRFDELVGLTPAESPQLRKLYFREQVNQRRTHIHVRQRGLLNQNYALLFRDYLRDNESVRECYGLIKQRLAEIFPNQIDGYLYIKDPLMDMIYRGAQEWAEKTHWSQDETFL